MAEQTKKGQTTNNAQAMLDKLSSLKREAYSYLDQALTFDSNTSSTDTKIDTAIIMYERCLKFISDALGYYETNRAEFAKHDDAIRVYNQLVNMKNQTNERLLALKNERIKATAANANKSSHINNDEFLDIGDDILNDSDCIIIDDFGVEESNHSKLINNTGGGSHLNDSDCVIIGDEKNSKFVNGKSDQNKNNQSSSNSMENQLRTKLKDLTKATEILRVDNGVQLFYIADDGTVSTPSYPTTLSIYSFDKNESSKVGKNVVGFVRVGSWMYPLVPSESPAMKTTFNAYIFPNNEQNEANSQTAGCSFIGITFANQTSDESKVFFEDVLSNYNLLIYQNREEAASGAKRPRIEEPTMVVSDANAANRPPQARSHGIEKRDTTSIKDPIPDLTIVDESTGEAQPQSDGWSAERVAQGLVTSATYVSQGISTGTDYATKYLQTGAEKLKTQLQPNTKPTQIDPKYQNLIQNVRYGTHVGVRVSSFLVNKLASLATYTAKTVGPHIRSGSTAILAKSGVVKDKNTANGYIDNISTIAHGTFQSYGIIYDSLETAAKTLGKNFTENTVTVVDHKYGQSAAQATKNGLYSVGNVALSVNNMRDFKIVRTMAKATAKEVISSSSSKSNLAGEDKKDLNTEKKKD